MRPRGDRKQRDPRDNLLLGVAGRLLQKISHIVHHPREDRATWLPRQQSPWRRREIIRKKAETEASEIAKLAMLKDREAARARRAAKAAALAQEKLDFEERVSKKRESRAWRAPGAAAGGRATSSTAGAPAMAPIPSYADTGPSLW